MSLRCLLCLVPPIIAAISSVLAPGCAEANRDDATIDATVADADAARSDSMAEDSYATAADADNHGDATVADLTDHDVSEWIRRDPADVAPRGVCPIEERLGGFVVEVQADYSLVDGKVLDGIVPQVVPSLVRELGDCQLWKRRTLFCDPPCVSGSTCGDAGACVPYPTQQDIGLVTIEGLKKAVVLEAIQPGNAYFDTDVPQPVFAPGCAVSLTSPGGRFGAMSLAGIGVELLGPFDTALTLERGTALVFDWVAGTGQRAEVLVTLSIDQHGSAPLSLRCSFEDDGAASVPAELIDALFDAGVSGFPNGRIARRTIDRQEVVGGCVDFAVASVRELVVRVAGVVPCHGDRDCPDGLSCNRALERCE